MENTSRISRFGIFFFCLLSLFFIGVTDYITGAELSFSIFYLLPILAATWFINRTTGFVLCVTGAGIWIASDLLTTAGYSNVLIPYWNGFVRLSFFMIFTFLVSWAKTGWDLEKDMARTDPLTGVENTRSFYELAGLELERTVRHKHPLSIAFLDLDNFKTVNDTKGHSTGDLVLKLVSELIQKNLRKIDIPARIGGDEFILLLPETDEKGATKVMERIRENLIDAMVTNGWPVTFSIGIATFYRAPKSVNEMISEADAVMYDVKKNGKNNIKSKVI